MPSPHPSHKDEPDGGDTLVEARRVLEVEAGAILSMVERLGESFRQAVDLLATCQGRAVTTGMGKSGIIARKMAATLASTGTPSLFLHPAEAVHGDLGNIVEEDVLVAISYSGETEEIARLLETIKRLGVPLIALTGKHPSTLSRHADSVLDVSVTEEACPMGLAPTASTTAALAMGDALAMSLLRRKGFRSIVGSSEEALGLPLLVNRDKRKKGVGELFCPLVVRSSSGFDLVERKQPTVATVAEFSGPVPGVHRDQFRLLCITAAEALERGPLSEAKLLKRSALWIGLRYS